MVRTLALGIMIVVGVSTAARADEYLKIGSWNIENLGDREWGQFPAALAEHVLMSGCDVIALQEIWDNDGDDDKTTNTKLDDTFRRVNESDGHDWSYALFPKRDPEDFRQHIGVAWNRRRVSLVGEPQRIDVDYALEQTWHRTPYSVKFSTGAGKSDLVLIPLHMKSNRRDAGEPDPVVVRQREAEALAARLDALRTRLGDHDIILLGDTNCLSADEPALAKFGEAGFLDLNGSDAITYSKGMYRSPFDRILVPRGQPEFRYSYQYVLTPAKPTSHLSRFSDHFLVLTAVRILVDDD